MANSITLPLNVRERAYLSRHPADYLGVEESSEGGKKREETRHVIVHLGQRGDELVRLTADLSRVYEKACWAAVTKGEPIPEQPGLPSVIAKSTRYFAQGNRMRGLDRPVLSLPEGVVVYRVPHQGWTLFGNGFSVIVTRPDGGTGRVVGTFDKALDAEVRTDKALVLQNEGKAWLASVKVWVDEENSLHGQGQERSARGLRTVHVSGRVSGR